MLRVLLSAVTLLSVALVCFKCEEAAAAAAATASNEFMEAEIVGGDEDDGGMEEAIAAGTFSTVPPGARGFNEDIAWVNSLPDALATVREEGRPAMVLIHNSACGACGKLKEVFTASDEADEIVGLSRGFVMVNLQNEEEPKANDDYSPDGSYIPRLFFVSKEGRVQYDLKNARGTEGYDYFYYRGEDVVREMKRAADKLGATGGAAAGGDDGTEPVAVTGGAAGGAAHDDL